MIDLFSEDDDYVELDPDLKAFSITSWYETYINDTLPTEIIPIPPSVRQLIHESLGALLSAHPTPELDDFLNQLTVAIERVGGKAFPKNNWHAPKDAKAFTLGNTLLMTGCKEVVITFSCSDIILNDFGKVTGDIPHVAAIKPWIDIHPATEFRAIVINKRLRGITPRDWPTYYTHYEDYGPTLIVKLKEFFVSRMKNFPANNFVFDVVMQSSDKIILLDIGPLNESTMLYAFQWKQIKGLVDKECPEEVEPVFRYLEADVGITYPGMTLKYDD